MPLSPESTRATLAALARTRSEQEKRRALLDSATAMAAYARDKGMSAESMRTLIATNFERNHSILAQLETTVASEEFRLLQAQERQRASTIRFSPSGAAPAQAKPLNAAELGVLDDDELYAYGLISGNLATPAAQAVFFAEWDRRQADGPNEESISPMSLPS